MRWGRRGIAIAAVVGGVAGCGEFLGITDEPPEPVDGPVDSDAESEASSATDGVEGGVSLDASVAPDVRADVLPIIGCRRNPNCERVVFVSSQMFDGNLGGLDGANELCNQLALQGDAHERVRWRRFVAWLAGTGIPVPMRMVEGQGSYVLPSGAIIASGWTEFASATHQSPIDMTEKGSHVNDYNVPVWTGANADGEPANSNCANWSSNAQGLFGDIGDAKAKDEFWTFHGSARACNALQRIYCVEE